MTRTLKIEWHAGEKVTARLAMPATPRRTGILLAHGAGAGQESRFMVHLRQGLAAQGFPTLTFDYRYVELGRRSPDRANVLLDVHAAAAERLSGYVEAMVLAGKSLGGRMASHLAADKGVAAEALVYYGYPLVAPGKSEPRATDHLGRIEAPQLFFSGTRDSLSPQGVVASVVSRLERATLVLVEGGDHSFRVPKRSGTSAEEVLDGLVADTVEWLQEELAST